MLHILDSFLFIAPRRDKCSTDLSKFLDMCSFLGVRFWDFVENAKFRKLQENIIVTGLRKKISSPDFNMEKQQYFHDV